MYSFHFPHLHHSIHLLFIIWPMKCSEDVHTVYLKKIVQYALRKLEKNKIPKFVVCHCYDAS